MFAFYLGMQGRRSLNKELAPFIIRFTRSNSYQGNLIFLFKRK
ncbi:hypothetical protein ACMBCN_02300 [Candidatus Liberibacter asiaticus]